MNNTPATTLQRLLKYPHSAVFDKAPGAELAMRIRHADNARWMVADEAMMVSAGALERVYPLADHTFATLAAALIEDGFEVPSLSPSWAQRSALAAVEGEGDQSETNGDHVQAYTSLLWALMSAYASEGRAAEHQVGQALRQMIVGQAEGEWLDLWGALYNEGRRQGESDASYAPRIPREAFRIRVNALAIEKAIKDHTGKDVVIEEPWGSMFRLDESTLSGGQRFYNGETVGYHLLRPVSRESIDWTDVLAVIHRNRAAGVIVLEPEVRMGRWIDASIDGTIWTTRADMRGSQVLFYVPNRLDYLVLSGEELVRNWPVMMSQTLTHANTDPLLDPYSLALRRTIAKASIVLSDGFALGEENAVFPRAELTQDGGAMHVSDDLELSSPDQKPVWKPVDFISTEIHGHGVVEVDTPVEVGTKPSIILGRFVDASIDGAVSVGITAGFTWVDAEVWGDFPWSLGQVDLLRFEASASRLHKYANVTLIDHLAVPSSSHIVALSEAATEVHRYANDAMYDHLYIISSGTANDALDEAADNAGAYANNTMRDHLGS
jgi:hypothetical protein